jgi:hypothetical protein
MRASRATMDDALREADFLLSGGKDVVWIDDEKGNVILSPADVRARLDRSASAPRRFARWIGARRPSYPRPNGAVANL